MSWSLEHTLRAQVVGSSTLQDDSPLMEAGMDSLSAVEFRNRIVGSLPDVQPAPPALNVTDDLFKGFHRFSFF